MVQLLNRKKRNQKGFTLIELIVVIAILAILAAILIPRFTGFQDKARETQAVVCAKQVATALDSFYAENNRWPTNATESAIVVTLAGDPVGTFLVTPFDDSGNDGGFTWQVPVGVGTYKAGRDSATTKIEVKH